MNKDMDFILGIVLGVALCLAYGNYLLRQRKKEEKNNPAIDNGSSGYYRGNFVATGKPLYFDPPYPVTVVRPLNEMLQDAVDREDYAAAARLRDLINKK